MAADLSLVDKPELFQRANHVRSRPIPGNLHSRLRVGERGVLVQMQARFGVSPLVTLVEMTLDQFPNHLDQFLHRPALRRHFRLMANGDEQSFFFADLEIEFHGGAVGFDLVSSLGQHGNNGGPAEYFKRSVTALDNIFPTPPTARQTAFSCVSMRP